MRFVYQMFGLFVVVVVLVTICVLLVGCSPPITNGEVQSRQFIPEHRESNTTYMKVGQVSVPITNHYTVPDKWYVIIGKEDEDGKWKTRTYQVDQQTYDDNADGDWLDFGDG